ncbi:MAG: SIR2 family protein [Nitrospinae bacterium]|nr:SIR2 family protein [Nitrospinota bacterium]
MITFFLGAGFSYVGGVPLARHLFEEEPQVDRINRSRLIDRVLTKWNIWSKKHGGMPEEYLSELKRSGTTEWIDAVWYVSLVIALKMGRLELIGLNPKITRHNVNRTTGIKEHEKFWTTIFRITNSISVLTTNYDILAERGLRHVPRPRVPRPGFHYGFGVETLAGGGYPSYAHIQKIDIKGSVPLLKLHGSVSWSFSKDQLIRYHDCRPAIRGDAAIIAPITQKELPNYLEPIWKKAQNILENSEVWIFIGYSLPKYDKLVLELLKSSSKNNCSNIHVFDPDPVVAQRFHKIFGKKVSSYPGIPDGIPQLQSILEKYCSTKREIN